MPVFLSRDNDSAIPEGLLLGYAAYAEWSANVQSGLSIAEKNEISRMGHERRRREFGLSRYLLREMRALLFPDDPEAFEILRDVGGKPYGLSRDRVIPVAVAHTVTHVFVAMSHSADVGLDAEPEHRAEHSGLRRRILHTSEFEDSDLRAVATLRLWAAKESILKLEGTGLRRSMKSVRVRASSDGALTAEVEGRFIRVNSLRCEGHWVAISEYISAPSDLSF